MTYIQELRALVGHRPLILVGALVLVFNDRHHLLLQYSTADHAWVLPGGYMELGETVEETARREVREETGLEIGELKLFKIYSGKEFFYKCPNGDLVYSVTPVYATNAAQGSLQADGVEGSEVKYFPIHDLPGDILPEGRRILEDYLKSCGM